MLARYYEVLGVDRYASRDEITAAYRRAAMRWHPDRNIDNPEAKEKFQEIEQAYRFLLQLTPAGRWDEPAPVPAADNAKPSQAEIDEAVEFWRKLRDAEKQRQEEYEQERVDRERQEHEALAQRQWFISPVLAMLLLFAALYCLLLLTYPLSVVLASTCLLLALLVCPRDDKTYTHWALRVFIQVGVKIYFIVLLLLLLLKITQQIVV